MKFEDKYFTAFSFTKEQIDKNFDNALRDLTIARKDQIQEVKFNYGYTAFLKAGITLLSFHQVKIKSQPGHHIKIIDKMAQILEDETVADMGNAMRVKRNVDLYVGGVEITEKECREYLDFADNVLSRVKKIIGYEKAKEVA